MNEIQVMVEQTPGTIQWNFEELKIALKNEMDAYSGLVYTDETIPTAKADVASLRKLKDSVEKRRIEIKKKCLEPYYVIEAQAAELTALIDEPIELIARQIKNYEVQQKALKKQVIMDYMDEKFSSLPPEIAKKAKAKIYDPKWENKSTTKKTWTQSIDGFQEEITRGLGIIQNTDEEFRDEVMKVYAQNLDLTAAMEKVQEMQHQKEIIMAAERKRQEEIRIQEERRKQAEDAKKKEKPEDVPQVTLSEESEDAIPSEPVDIIGDENNQNFYYGLVTPDEFYGTTAQKSSPYSDTGANDSIVNNPGEISVGDVIDSVEFEAFQNAVGTKSASRDGSTMLKVWADPQEMMQLEMALDDLRIKYKILD